MSSAPTLEEITSALEALEAEAAAAIAKAPDAAALEQLRIDLLGKKGKLSGVLGAMGKNVLRAGDSGAGQIAKICNNMLLAVQMIGTAEALALGETHGVDPSVLSEIMLASSGRNWSLEVYNPWPGVMENAPASKGYQGGFMVDLMHKDLGLALDAAQHEGASTPMGALARSLYALHRQAGHGRLDFSSIQSLLRAQTDADQSPGVDHST